MGVEVDEPRREGEAVRVDLALARAVRLSDGADASVADRDVRPDRFVAETVDDGRSANDELIHEVPFRARVEGPRG